MNISIIRGQGRTEIISTIQEAMQMIFQKMLNMTELDASDEMEAEIRFEEMEEELIDEFIESAHMGHIETIISERLEDEFSDILDRA